MYLVEARLSLHQQQGQNQGRKKGGSGGEKKQEALDQQHGLSCHLGWEDWMGSGENERGGGRGGGHFLLEKAPCLSFGTDPIVKFNLRLDKKQLALALLPKGNMVSQQQVDLIIE